LIVAVLLAVLDGGTATGTAFVPGQVHGAERYRCVVGRSH